MVAFSFSELLILLALAGVPVNDAASLIDPPGYLKAHDVELNAERLAELIARDPRGGKEQMTQLQQKGLIAVTYRKGKRVSIQLQRERIIELARETEERLQHWAKREFACMQS